MFDVNPNTRDLLYTAIDNGTAVEVKSAMFRDGYEDEILVRFFRHRDSVYRVAYDGRSTRTRISEVDGEDRDLFDTFYPDEGVVNADRFRECLAVLGWSQRGLAAMIGMDERQVRRWAAGEGVVPEDIATWLETLARVHEDNPPPRRH